MDNRSTPPDALDGLDPLLCDKYFSGACTPADLRKIEAWVAGNPARKAALGGLRLGLRSPVYPAFVAASELQIRINKVLGTIPKTSRESARGRALPVNIRASWRGPMRFSWIMRSAVALAAVVAVVFGVRSAFVPSNAPVTRYATTHGERVNAVLSDGSRIILAPESRLEYTTDSRGARVVTLSGQAHFTVTHDARRPFTVRTGTVETQVLGTAFDIRHYGSDSAVQIVVVAGKVAARGRSGRGAPVVLSTGTEGHFTDSTARIVTNQKIDEAEAWTRGHLMFEDTPMSEVLRVLQRWYGYEFRLTDAAIATQEVTARFAISDTVNTFAELKELLNVTLRFDGSIVTLSPIRGLKKTGPARHRWPNAFPSPKEVGK